MTALFDPVLLDRCRLSDADAARFRDEARQCIRLDKETGARVICYVHSDGRMLIDAVRLPTKPMSTSATPPTNLSTLPTEFRGCTWNDGWEFECPAVVYYPPHLMAFQSTGSHGHIDSLVEDICMSLSLGWDHNDGGLKDESDWRGWSKRGFARRKDATHVVIKVRWEPAKHGDEGPMWHEVSRVQTKGPPPKRSTLS